MKSGSFGYNGRCAYITSADGMVHPVKNEAASAHRKGMYEYKPYKGEDINICLECENSVCDGGKHCPMQLTLITLEEYKIFRTWMIDALNNDLCYRKIRDITGIAQKSASEIVSGKYPGKRIQRKIKEWIKANKYDTNG